MDKKRLAPILVLMMLSAVTAGALVLITMSFSGGGQIVARHGLGIYSNPGATNPIQPVVLGNLYRGVSTDFLTFYVKNEGEVKVHLILTSVVNVNGVPSTLSTLTYYDINGLPVPQGQIVGDASVFINPNEVWSFRYKINVGLTESIDIPLTFTATVQSST